MQISTSQFLCHTNKERQYRQIRLLLRTTMIVLRNVSVMRIHYVTVELGRIMRSIRILIEDLFLTINFDMFG